MVTFDEKQTTRSQKSHASVCTVPLSAPGQFRYEVFKESLYGLSDEICTFFKEDFPSEPDFLLSFGFNLQTTEIQTAVDMQSDSKQRAIGFKTADQKIAMLFRLRLFHYTLQWIFKLTFSLYMCTL